MRNRQDKEHLEQLRERLYARTGSGNKKPRSSLKDEPIAVPTAWDMETTTNSSPGGTTKEQPAVGEQLNQVNNNQSTMTSSKRRRAFRFKLLLAGIFFFIGAVTLSSLFIFFGGNAISGENIEVDISGPFTIAGGETLRLQLGVTNQNAIPIESATLIIEYPTGTKSADDEERDLFTERIALEQIESGETVNVPVQVKVFGQENNELRVQAAVEYRVRGSNATFFKEAEPLLFKISSSPVVLDVDAPRSLAPDQETDVVINVRSNSITPLRNILVRADFPSGFDFSSSNPQPVAGENVWRIDSIEPEETAKITVRGAFIGSAEEGFSMTIEAGLGSERDQFTLASVLASNQVNFELENAFVDVSLLVNDTRNGVATITNEESSNATIEVRNTLDDTIYDAVVEVRLSGNAVEDSEIQVSNGYYNSNSQTITWDISSVEDLERILPGNTERLSFSIFPDTKELKTPNIVLDASVKARRVSETDVQEEVTGTVQSEIKIESALVLDSKTSYNTTTIQNDGPVPPKVGETTEYTILWELQNGSNSISDAVVSATLPSYVSWSGETSGNGVYSYNPATRQVEWNVGTISAKSTAESAFEVSFTPSASQIDQVPTIVESQRVRAEDAFTRSIIRDTTSALTTQLSRSEGYDTDSGVVRN